MKGDWMIFMGKLIASLCFLYLCWIEFLFSYYKDIAQNFTNNTS